MTDRKDEFRIAVRVGVMLARLQVRGMIEQSIQNVWRLADVTGDDLRVEGDPEIGDMSIDANPPARRGEVLRMKGGIKSLHGNTIPTGIRTGRCALTPCGG